MLEKQQNSREIIMYIMDSFRKKMNGFWTYAMKSNE